MERLTRGRAVFEIEGIRMVYERNRENQEVDDAAENIHNMSIEGEILCFVCLFIVKYFKVES